MADPKCVLAFMAHPDDAEFNCAGTLARLHTEHNWRVAIATMTPGDCGSADRRPEDIIRVRLEEARAAALVLDGDFHCADLRDLFIFYDPDALRRTVAIIRRVRPDLVITHSPQDYMLDHEVTSTLVRAATFGAPMPNFALGETWPADRIPAVPHLYYADAIEGHDIFGRLVEPSLLVDVTAAMETKERMLVCHASQRDWLRAHHKMDEFVESMRRWMAMRGRQAGVPYAEAFRQHLGHGYPADDLLGDFFGRTLPIPF